MRKYWLSILVIGVLVIFILALPAPRSNTTPSDRLVRIKASQYAFSPGTIRVNPGDRVVIELNAIDVVHGFYLDGYGISISADPGQISSLQFIADRAGSYRFRCSVACGDMHPFMIGKLQVGTNWLFWRGATLFSLVLMSAIWFGNKRVKWI